ncbi:MAG: serine/threonine protein kinase, partial [Labilithrix sp.]|nr:serine/threonine protein kinase [Labilithrix sp.]
MPDPPSLVGHTIAHRYCIEQLVGGGAMGDVYRARHVGLGSDVAVKIMRASIADASNFKERFYREAKAASRLAHPNSVRVLDYGEEPDGLVYLVMEFLRGRDLQDVLTAEWPLSDRRIVDILAQTLAAISTAHGHGIVHRDLKPENIMIVPDDDEEGRDCVKVCDFGIAKLVDARAFKSHDDVQTALTTGNAIIGTPEYMSPEQARGEALDARSDLYSVGVILYRMLTRRLPFEAENALGIAVKHIVEEPLPPSRVVDSPNPRLEAICMRALRKDPRDRYATAKEMRAELRAALGGDPSG